MITVKNLVKKYGNNEVLKNISFEIQKGEIYGFIGHNGAGKSTTMNILTGLLNYDAGDIIINGLELKRNKKEILKKIGYLPEEPKFYNYMTGKEYLNFIGMIIYNNPKEINKRTEELLELVKLNDAKNKKVGNYSRGMKQRLGIATALYNNPEILILDEPSSALDPGGRKDIVDIIENLKSKNITIFLSTHILNDIERVCDRIGIINKGEIILNAPLDDILNKYVLPVYDIEIDKDYNNIENLKSKVLNLDFVEKIFYDNNKLSIYVKEFELSKKKLLNELIKFDIPIISYQIRKPTLEDIYMRVVYYGEKF